MQPSRWSIHSSIATVLALLLVLSVAPLSTSANSSDIDPFDAPDPIPDIWYHDDSNNARAGDHHTWIWGPSIREAAIEPYAESPDEERTVYYFDKARMEINNPNGNTDDSWYSTSGLLVREMVLGRVQLGDNTFDQREPASAPLTGDTRDNEISPTYADLAQFASVGSEAVLPGASDRTGEKLTSFMGSEGNVYHNVVHRYSVNVGYYEPKQGHNIPSVFWDWMNGHSSEWLYLTGYPITEPYWVETRVKGKRETVLVQAFERRILTYTPSNPAGWQVETGNAGLHYRAWRGIDNPITIEPREDRRDVPEEPPTQLSPPENDDDGVGGEPDDRGGDLIYLGTGPAAYYSASYDREWWDNVIGRHAGWGNAVDGWTQDPNGHYCVHPDYRPGERLQLVGSNGVTLMCTIGDSVAAHDVSQWRAKWTVELRWETFLALGLDRDNSVSVYGP